MGYKYAGTDVADSSDRDRWEGLSLRQLASEQVRVCADTARQKRREALERLGLTLRFADEFTRFGGTEGLAAAVAEAFGGAE